MPASPKGHRTEGAMLDAARQVFAEKGYLNAKVSDIAVAANRSPASFYNYYDNKEQILEALLGQFSADILEATLEAKTGDPLEGIRGAVRAYWVSYRRYLPEIIGVFQMSMTDNAFAQRWRANRAAGIRAVLSGLDSAERKGYRITADRDMLASALVSMLEGFCWTWLAMGGEADNNGLDEDAAIEALSVVWYGAVYRTPPDQ
ncbi:TetR/AcrR family transcriptional regulator [Gordonia sp. CPCC 206044]|uniref:TetR/AcrR family transcriptional regulator n=1 Tax=Gordonia sp. CPCC 206044 TaxID=3140793 RepID=UPI003AF34F7F